MELTPILLAPMAGPGTPELTAAAANAGVFPFLACAYSDAAQMRRDIMRVRELTDRPFGVNLFVEQSLPRIDERRLADAYDRLNVYRKELDIAAAPVRPTPPQRYTEQLDVVLETRPYAFSFTFGIPSSDDIARLKDANIYTVGTATTVEEARQIERAGIDAVCAQGAEAGGHRGSFVDRDPLPLIGTVALVPQIVDAVRIPVIAAGGIGDGRGVAAVLALGAVAAQLGTAFIRAPEARTAHAYRDALATASAGDTLITRAFSGRPARGIGNRMTHELADESAYAPYPFQNAFTRDIRNAAAEQGRSEFLSLWAGQAFPLAREESVAAIVERIRLEAAAAIEAGKDRLR